jgi:NAD(P)-dependent dehydrogenase (short-subunit alcohol dehydrogenase family)
MKDKVCLVTGATAGIGEVTALALAKQGATVVIVSRNQQRCEETVRRIRQESNNPAVDYLVADLSSQADIRRVASQYQDRYNRLDVLVNNAGGFFSRRQESLDGIELTWALNHLNYFMLTQLLLDTILASAPARVINVSSNAHLGGQINFDDLQARRGYFGWRVYAQSKLANVLHAYELARRLDGSRVTVNALHPGFVATRFAGNNGLLYRFGLKVAHLFALTPEQGARTNIYLASSEQVQGVTGKYYVAEKPASSAPISYDEQVARRLWDVSAEMVGLS